MHMNQNAYMYMYTDPSKYKTRFNRYVFWTTTRHFSGHYVNNNNVAVLTHSCLASRKKALACSVDPNETPHDAASHLGLR